MSRLKRLGRWIADFFEVYLPIAVFVVLLLAFLINVFFRYILRDPQNWTFELSVNAFVIVGLLGACAAYRKEDHVVFDLLYARLGPRGQSILRMVSHAVLVAAFLIAIPLTFRYLVNLPSVTSILRIPDRYIFSSFLILLISSAIRSAWRLALDIQAFRSRTYVQRYNREEKDALI